ncbi:MAG: DNA cytosine methyltransferase [Ardenticatenales bacterium]|nr:DNA cytosine methyltransferase [Ardenticatenales bacterium]
MPKTLRAIDLFCGAGGSSYGAQSASIEIAAGFDMWEPAIKTYRLNFPQAKMFSGDIRILSSNNIKKIKSLIGKVDLIIASPECTNHSKARGAAKKSEESRKTAFEVIRFARIFRPPWMVIENVIEMQTWDKHSELLKSLWDLGYFIREIVLNSKDFGVPQSRERLFILCSLSAKATVPTIQEQFHKTAQDIIDTSGKYSLSPLKKKGRAEKTIQSAERAIAALGENTPFLLVYYGSGRNGKGGWQNINEPLRTVTTLDRFAYVVPGNSGHMMRMLQPEELKLAMGFKPDFNLSNVDGLTRRDRIKLMGNGVCPPVMEAAVRSLTSMSP